MPSTMASDLEKREDHSKNEGILRVSPFIEEIGDFSYSQVADSCVTQESIDYEESDSPLETDSKHHVFIVAEMPGPAQCHLCENTYKNKKSLASHLRLKHRTTLKIKANMPCLEKNCGFRGSRITSLISHLIQAHGKKFQCEKVTFPSQDEFWKWKKKTEDASRSSYPASTSAKELVFGDKKIFFRCNRSGYSRTCSGSTHNAHEKKNMKINAVCTSFMNANFSKDGGAAVFFCKTHYGHEQENSYRYSRLTTFERDMMKALLSEGLTASEIITFMKTQLPEHRHHLLKYSNIRNLSVKDNLYLNRDKRPLDDKLFSEKEASSPVIKSSDFCLDLSVENEVEVETGTEEPESLDSPFDSQRSDCRSPQSADCNAVDKLRSGIVEKVQLISRLALGIVSQESLSMLNKNLDNILKDIKDNELIEVVTETVESRKNDKQNSLMLEDDDGNIIQIVCSDKDVNELTI